MARRVWASVAALVIVALGLTVGSSAVAAAPKVTAGSKSPAVKSSAARLGSGGVRLSGRLDGSGRLPAMRPLPKKSAGSTAVPAGNPRQGVWYTDPFTIQPGAWSDAYVLCPAGMLATGGGESNTSAAGVRLHDTHAWRDGSGWEVRVTNVSASASTYQVYAVCWSGLTSYTQVTATQNISADDYSGVGADCPRGMSVYGGGGWTDRTDVPVSWWMYVDVGYGFSSMNMLVGRGSGSGTITAQAVCGTGINNYQSAGARDDNVHPGVYESLTANCPSGTFVTGGAVGADMRAPEWVTDSYPPFSQGWKAYFKNDGSSDSYADVAVLCGT